MLLNTAVDSESCQTMNTDIMKELTEDDKLVMSEAGIAKYNEIREMQIQELNATILQKE